MFQIWCQASRLIPGAILFISAFAMWSAPSFAQTASIGGTVMIDPSEKPLANAEIVISALNRSTRSDSAGNFVLAGLPAGRLQFVVRLVGYESSKAEVNLNSTQKFEADILLKPTTTKLDKVNVKGKVNAEWTIKLKEFEERRAVGVGRYLTEADFANEGGRSVGGILAAKIPGVRAVQQNGRNWLASLRGGRMYSCKQGECGGNLEQIPPACYMQVVVNGIVRYRGAVMASAPGKSGDEPMYDVNELSASDIIGVEFYTTATTPLQYNASRGPKMGSCGTIIIWTKGGG